MQSYMYVSLRQPNMYNMLITTTQITSKIDILNIANKKGQHVKSHLRMFLENEIYFEGVQRPIVIRRHELRQCD